MVLKAKVPRRNRKRYFSEDSTQRYEKVPRVSESYNKESAAKRLKQLLPIKIHSGVLIHQYREEEYEDNSQPVVIDERRNKEDEGTESEESPTDYVLDIQQRKTQIAKICSNIINDPQKNVHELKKLLKMLWEKRPSETCVVVRKLAMASLTCIFTDIIPGYHIRERTEEEKDVKLSKDVRSLVDFEEGLLQHYQQFLSSLEKVLRSGQRNVKRPIFTPEEHKEIIILAVKSLCELYEKTPHFNFYNNIIVVLVPLTNSRNKCISDMCCTAVRNVFRSDKSGRSILSTIKVLSRLIKDESASKKGVRPAVLDTLLSLHIDQVDFEAMSKTGLHKMNAKEKKRAAMEKKKLSRGQRKHLKRQEKLQNELKAVEATERRETKLKYHTEIIQQVFLVYFRVLKRNKGNLLNSVLEGLARFAHLINIDFFSDLIVVLQNLVTSGELTFRQNLYCMSTAFKVLSGQGELLNIDPTEFYKHLYRALLQVSHCATQVTRATQAVDQSPRVSDLNLMLDCLNIMLNKRRKQVTLSRLFAYIKRLCALSLNLHPGSAVGMVLDVTEKLLKSNSKTNALFDVDSQAKGVYMPELGDPEHCGASATCLWELHVLRRHFCPDVRTRANILFQDFLRRQH